MTFSISIFLYIFGVFLALWFVFFVVALYHMLKFGAKSFITIAASIIFVSIAVLILMTSSFYINRIDWNVSVQMMEGFFNSEMNFK